MARMTDSRSVAANSQVDNIIQGKLHEFLGEDSVVRLGIAASAAGLRCSFLIGGEAVVQDQEVSRANRFPIFPDDVVAEGAGFGGDRILVSLRNTTGSAITADSVVDVEPVV